MASPHHRIYKEAAIPSGASAENLHTSERGRATALLIAASLVVILAIAMIVLAWNWPFTRKAVTQTLEQRFARTVQIRSFGKTYFPPGCVAEGVSFLHRKRISQRFNCAFIIVGSRSDMRNSVLSQK